MNLLELNNPRKLAIDAMKNSVPVGLWGANKIFIESLKQNIKSHSLCRNPIIEVLNDEKIDLNVIKKIHLEYRHAIVQIFTDALLMAQFQSRQLETRLGAASKMPARFLLTLNILDEFGFQPGLDTHSYYKGNPAHAHYPLFQSVLGDLAISEHEIKSYKPSKISDAVRNCLEESYYDYSSILALLAVAEEQVILFSPPLRKALQNLDVDVSSGYYNVHGTTSDDATNAADDDHEDDLWHALTQAITPIQYESLRKICMQYCNLWDEFWAAQHKLIFNSASLESSLA